MKFALFALAVIALVWLLRGAARRRVRPPGAKPVEPGRPAQAMLACAVCGVHMPRDEALPGRGGVFCSEAHRAAFEESSRNP